MTGEMARKKVGIRLPRQVTAQSTEQRWAHELEALAPIADIIEIPADTPAEFAAGARDVDAIITSWGMRIDKQIIGAPGALRGDRRRQRRGRTWSTSRPRPPPGSW